MSWNISARVNPDEDIKESLLTAKKQALVVRGFDPGEAEPTLKQIDTAIFAAIDIASRMFIDGRVLPINIALSGHANPNNTPRSGWGNDFVSINISQLSK